MLKYPFLLLDDESLPRLLGPGTFKIVGLSFADARAIMNLHNEDDMICCFANNAIEKIIYEYIGIDKKQFRYQNVQQMVIGQDALVFRLYTTPSETKPIVETPAGYEARKIQNNYVYCELLSRLE